MTKIYLIRHAEAEGNLYRRIHGQYDSLVTGLGYRQIEALEKRFKDEKIDAVYSSDLIRTRVTASAIYKSHNLELRTTPELREVHMGVWEDIPWGEVERFEPDQLDYFTNDPLRWDVEGREDFRHLQDRLTNAVKAIAQAHEGETVAVFSHGAAIRAFLCGVKGLSPSEISLIPHSDNTAVALLNVDGGKIDVEYFGDNSHLPEVYSTFAHQKWWREKSTFDNTNMWFAPVSSVADQEIYLDYRKRAFFGKEFFSPEGFLYAAKVHAANNPRALSLALKKDRPVGVIELDPADMGEDGKAGLIVFTFIEDEFRGTGMAVQLIGEAVSVYRGLGRERLRLFVDGENRRAVGYYKKYGFVEKGAVAVPGGKRIMMEMDISLQQ